MPNLLTQHCVPCQGGEPPLTESAALQKLQQLDDWKLVEGKKITKTFGLGSFTAAIAFINAIARLAETEGHHPDLHNYYDKVTVELMTHKIHGLHENDFILAAKIDQLVAGKSPDSVESGQTT